MGGLRATVLRGALLALLLLALVPAAPAAASLEQLLDACSQQDAVDGKTDNGVTIPIRFCDDGVPSTGGETPNQTADKAVAVPAAYDGAVGLPPKAGDAASMPGANTAGDIALDVDLTLPDPAANPMPASGYPVVVMMHGCCSGNKSSWESPTLDGLLVDGTNRRGPEHWHYNNAWFAARGYVVVTYTSRGFVDKDEKGSSGQMQLNSDRFEINDYQHLVGQLADKADLDPESADTPRIDPQKIVATGGSYGGGFTWGAFTDPTWSSPGGTPMRLAAAAPKYGWTSLLESLVPFGFDRRDELPDSNPEGTVDQTIGFPKRTINNGLYLAGKTGFPTVPEGNHTTFPPEIDQAQACLSSSDPFTFPPNPACAGLEALADRFINEASAYFENDFFAALASGSIQPVPLFSAGTFSDTLFPAAEHRRMVERLRATVSNYPVQEYYGDYQHFAQNKAKEWGDLCGADRHICNYADYPGGDLNADPPSLAREHGVTTRLNRFLDHYVKPPANTSEPAPALDVTASLQVCQNLPGDLVDEPGPRFTAPSFGALAPNSLTIEASGAQSTTSNAEPNEHAVRADPVANLASNSNRCVIENDTAGPGVATYDSATLASDFTMLGPPRLTVQHTGSGPVNQLNARLYDLFPDGTAVMIDRGVGRVAGTSGPSVLDLDGNGWRFLAGHRIRIEMAQDDDPYIKSSTQPSSLSISAAKLEIPVREGSAGVGGAPPSSESGAAPSQPGAEPSQSGAAGRPRRVAVALGRPSRVRRGRFKVRCRARGTGHRVCAVRVRHRRLGGRVRTIGFGRRTIRGRSALVTVRLNRRGRALLRRSRRGLAVRLDARVRDATGNPGAASRRTRLRR